jgi:hypothetical protein
MLEITRDKCFLAGALGLLRFLCSISGVLLRLGFEARSSQETTLVLSCKVVHPGLKQKTVDPVCIINYAAGALGARLVAADSAARSAEALTTKGIDIDILAKRLWGASFGT